MNNKERYNELCKNESSIPIFSRDWWMDAVCGSCNWDVILLEKGDNVIAALPYHYVKRKNGLDIRQPQLTQTNGIWIKYPSGQKYSKKLSFEKEVMTDVIEIFEKLNLVSYNQNFKYNITNWLPFYWKNFKQTTRYTYVIEDLGSIEQVVSNFDHAKRKNLKKAEKLVTIKYDLPYEEFYKNHELTLSKQGSKISYSLETFKNIYEATYSRDCGKVFYAVDEGGIIHAAVFIIWDENSAYDLISTIDPDFRESGASTLVIYEAIKYVSTRVKVFDFEGSMIENVENSFRQFGAIQKPYFNISKQYHKKSLLTIIAKDVYDNSAFFKKSYDRLRGK